MAGEEFKKQIIDLEAKLNLNGQQFKKDLKTLIGEGIAEAESKIGTWQSARGSRVVNRAYKEHPTYGPWQKESPTGPWEFMGQALISEKTGKSLTPSSKQAQSLANKIYREHLKGLREEAKESVIDVKRLVGSQETGKFLGGMKGLEERWSMRKQLGFSSEQYNKGVYEMGKALGFNNEAMEQYMKKAPGMKEHMKKIFDRAIVTVPVWMLLRTAIQFVTKSFELAIKSAIEWESTMAEIKIVGKGTAEEYKMLSHSLLDLGKTYGTSLKDLGEGAKLWAQQGEGLSNIIPLMETTIKLSMITGKTVAASVEDLTSVMKTYNYTALESISIVDKLEKVELGHAITTNVLVDAIRKVAPVASQYGVSFEKLLGIITATHVATRATGEEIGTAWKSIFVRMRTNAIDAIQSIAKVPIYLDASGNASTEASTKFRNMEDVLSELAIVYPKLNQFEQQQLQTQLAQKRQVNYLTSAFQEWDEAVKVSIEALDSYGTADKAVNTLLGTTESKLKQLQNTWAELGVTIIDNGEFIKTFLEGLKGLVFGIETLFLILTKNGAEVAKMDWGQALTKEHKKTLDNYQKQVSLLSETESLNKRLLEIEKVRSRWEVGGNLKDSDEKLKSLRKEEELIKDALKNKPEGNKEKLDYLKVAVLKEEDLYKIQMKILALRDKNANIPKANIEEYNKLKEEETQLKGYGKDKEYLDRIKLEEISKKNKLIAEQAEEQYIKKQERELKLIEARKVLGDTELDTLQQKLKYYENLEAMGETFDIDKKDELEKQIEISKKEKEYGDIIKDRETTLKVLEGYGYDSLDIEKKKLELMKEQGALEGALEEQRRKIRDEELNFINKHSEAMRSSLAGSIKDMMSGTGNISNLFTNVNKTMIDSYRGVVSEGVSSLVMGSTGGGAAFGGGMLQLKEAFGLVQEKVEDKIDTSNIYLRDIAQDINDIANGNAPAATGIGDEGRDATLRQINVFQRLGAKSSVANKGLIGLAATTTAGWLTGSKYNPKTKQYETTATQKSGESSEAWAIRSAEALKKANKGQGTSQMIMGGIEGIMTGYSSYQSAKAGGASTAGAVMSGVGGVAAVGSSAVFGAIAAGGLSNSWNPVGWILLIIAALLLIGSLFMKSKKSEQTSSQTQSSEAKVSSKIDITNKQLEIVNRNLVALKNTITTYILPSSAYFAEKYGLDEQFAVNSKRGLL